MCCYLQSMVPSAGEVPWASLESGILRDRLLASVQGLADQRREGITRQIWGRRSHSAQWSNFQHSAGLQRCGSTMFVLRRENAHANIDIYGTRQGKHQLRKDPEFYTVAGMDQTHIICMSSLGCMYISCG